MRCTNALLIGMYRHTKNRFKIVHARIAEKDKFDAARRKSMELTRRFKEHHVKNILGIIKTIDNELDSDDYI